jgi:outer membrane receptor protein involved in Fe transport
MALTSRIAGALLITSALVSPSLAMAQAAPTDDASATSGQPQATAESGTVQPLPETPKQEEDVDVSIPGGGAEILVTGTRDRNIAKGSDQVVSVLSNAEIQRTGEGNIAGALSRVTGLSVVGSGYVYVRGLGDRYSLALLNGSPLPSPEPLKRVVPLDMFPSSVISSSLVQKSYSVNFPGEFGGGVINLTTKAIPQEPFLNIEVGMSGDSETTGQLGYVYGGSDSDWTGFDNGTRDVPPALQAFFKSGQRMSSGDVDTQAIGSELVRSWNAVIGRRGDIPPNFAAALSGGKSWDIGWGELGLIAAAGYSNKWLTRDATQQSSLSSDLSTLESDFRRVSTDNRIVVNGLLGLGLEWDNNQVRWTNLFIRDTIKTARLGLGHRQGTGVDFMQQDTAWYERQLINTQLVGELNPADGVKVDLRASYANSQREAPYELSFEYARTNSPVDPFGNYFINILNNGNRGNANVSFSDLNEDLWAGGIDVSYVVTPEITATGGFNYADTKRFSSRRDFQFTAPSSFPEGVGLFRPDLLLQPSVIDAFNIQMIELNEGNPAFDAELENFAGYLKGNAQITSELSLDIGVRYEDASQVVTPAQVFTVPGGSTAATSLKNDYWLPAATLTWQFQPDMQVRLNASKTIARPQFRELIYQFYFDPESNRTYQGNPLLIDSQLWNAEARYEWYFDREQRLSVSGFYKKIDNPIESFVTGSDFITSYANAPEATLYGVELEVQKFFDLSSWGDDTSFWANRRLLVSGNYTYTKSELKVRPGDTTAVFGAAATNALDYFDDGAPLTGQSDHIANLQLGIESTEKLSQFTFLLSYASKRVVSRGVATIDQPDIFEKPGFLLDFVARESFDVADRELELKFQARNILGTKHQEFQESGDTRIDTNTYDVGTTLALSAIMKF